MHAITLTVGPLAWSLLFKTAEKAQEAWTLYKTNSESEVEIADDFGQIVHAFPGALTGGMLEDLNETKRAHIERALHQARMQNEVQQAAEADAGLRLRRGPAMLSPMGMPGGFNGVGRN